MPFKFRLSRWGVAVLIAVVFLLACLLFLRRSNEPVYQGRPLGKWLRGHPKDYYPAVLALGTNALPYLLAELQATDSRASQWGQDMLAKVSMGPFWRTARDRRYRAQIGLQILDTNAVPALMGLIFSKPIRNTESDAGVQAAMTLGRLASTQAQEMAEARLLQALKSSDAGEYRNAALVLPFWPRSSEEIARSLVAGCQNSNPAVRAAALQAIGSSEWREEVFLTPLIACLEDEQAQVRRYAVVTLWSQRSKARAALPALYAAYTNELFRSSFRGDLGAGDERLTEIASGNNALSARSIREAIRDAIKAIDPSGPLPSDPQ